MGQNFLHDKSILRSIAHAPDLEQVDTILEVGPGTGNLTEELLGTGKRIIAIEKDRDLLQILQSRFENLNTFTLEHHDILSWQLPADVKNFGVIANIPYYITTPLIKKFLQDEEYLPKFLVLLVQKEFAQKAISLPPHMSGFGAYLRAFGDVKIVRHVSKSYFTPVPKVDSSVLLITPHTRPPRGFLQFIQQAHSTPRKKVRNSIRLNTVSDHIAPLLEKRPSELSLQNLEELWEQSKQ